MTDITTKLRGMMVWNATANEAADEIDRLRAANRYLIDMHDAVIDDARKYTAAQAEIARLREALESASAFNVGQNVIVKKCWQRDGSCLWAVQRFDEVLANDGMGWNYELQPSDRDEAFMARYRFATMELAMTAARAALATVEGVGNG